MTPGHLPSKSTDQIDHDLLLWRDAGENRQPAMMAARVGKLFRAMLKAAVRFEK